jgi:hypothetical protein
MKLVEILARDVSEWPDGCAGATQDDDGETAWFTGGQAWFDIGFKGWRLACGGNWVGNIHLQLSDDYTTAIVTREQWEAARNLRLSTWSAWVPAPMRTIDSLDPQVRQNLIALGWLPPEDVQALRDLLNRSTQP